jgi:transcriptional regulator with PAS, ATPase and Fis domain
MPAELKQIYRIDPADLPGEAVIFGSTAAMREVRGKIESILSNDLPVLIQGENGTGKEVIAGFLHARSSRGDAPFVRINCAAVPSRLLEIELFGYIKEPSIGVGDGRPGLVEVAEGGTLFLDEVENLSWELQEKVLRLLQEGSYSGVGSTEKRFARVRVICATSADLQEAVEIGTFREDLFYRMAVVTLHLSALRDRKSDIPQLCDYLVQKLSRKFHRSVPRLSHDTFSLLTRWDWPGNLRELENWVARAVILGEDEAVGAELRRQAERGSALPAGRLGLGSAKNRSRRPPTPGMNLLLKALRANHWNRRKTAEKLNISYRSLLLRMHDFGLPQRPRGHTGLPPH